MANCFLLTLIILLLVLEISYQRVRKCGNIECAVEANGCKQNSAGIQVCDCFVGIKGDACEIDIDECTEHGRSPCGHRGNCVNNVGSYKCDCVDGWSGMTCRILTHPPNFDCFPGWTGTFCNDDIDECTNGAIHCPGPHEYCTNTNGNFTCTCDAGWKGTGCMQDVDECAYNPCGMNRMCQNTIGSFECPCLTGWYGGNCDQNIDECVLKPCGTSGSCVDTNGSFVCECLSGYTGDVCEIIISDNSMSPSTYVVIGCLAGFAFIILMIAIIIYCCMRSKLQDLRQTQEEAERRKRIQDRRAKIQPFAPMFAVKRRMDDNDNNSATAKPTQYRNKHDTDTKQKLEGHIHAVKPMDINRDNSRSTRHHNSAYNRNQTDGEDLNAENKWDHKRPRNYNSPNHTGPAGMSSKNSKTAPSPYGTDILSDNIWNSTRRPPKHFMSPRDKHLNGRSSESSPSITQSHNSPIGINKIRVTSDSPLHQTSHDQYETDLISDKKWNNNRQTSSNRSQIGIKPSMTSSNSPPTPTVYNGKGLNSDYKWDSSRRTKNYNTSNDIIRSRMSSDSSLQQIIPVHYQEDPVFDY